MLRIWRICTAFALCATPHLPRQSTRCIYLMRTAIATFLATLCGVWFAGAVIAASLGTLCDFWFAGTSPAAFLEAMRFLARA